MLRQNTIYIVVTGAIASFLGALAFLYFEFYDKRMTTNNAKTILADHLNKSPTCTTLAGRPVRNTTRWCPDGNCFVIGESISGQDANFLHLASEALLIHGFVKKALGRGGISDPKAAFKGKVGLVLSETAVFLRNSDSFNYFVCDKSGTFGQFEPVITDIEYDGENYIINYAVKIVPSEKYSRYLLNSNIPFAEGKIYSSVISESDYGFDVIDIEKPTTMN